MVLLVLLVGRRAATADAGAGPPPAQWAVEAVPLWLDAALAAQRRVAVVGGRGGETANSAVEEAGVEALAAGPPVRPLRMPELAVGWPALVAWENCSAFLGRHGGALQHARWPGGGRQLGVLARRVSVRGFVGEMARPEAGLLFDGSTVGVGGEWEIPSEVAKAGAVDSFLSVGGGGKGLPFHNHQAAWEAVVVGLKLFVLLEPHLAGAGAAPGWLLLRPLAELLQPGGQLAGALERGRLPESAGGRRLWFETPHWQCRAGSRTVEDNVRLRRAAGSVCCARGNRSSCRPTGTTPR